MGFLNRLSDAAEEFDHAEERDDEICASLASSS